MTGIEADEPTRKRMVATVGHAMPHQQVECSAPSDFNLAKMVPTKNIDTSLNFLNAQAEDMLKYIQSQRRGELRETQRESENRVNSYNALNLLTASM